MDGQLPVQQAEIIPVPSGQQPPADRHPALVYLASVAPGTRPSVRSGLQVVAEILSGGRCDLFSFPWASLRTQHTLALRAELASRYAHGRPTGSNGYCWRIQGRCR